jgi:hypothetical protein
MSPGMSPLRNRLHDLATSFADNVLAAIRTASLDELTGTKGGGAGRAVRGGGGMPDPLHTPKTKGGRLTRRSPEDIEKALSLVVAALKVGPMRAEEIKTKLGLDKRELPRVLAEGLKSKKLRKTGAKRATTYSAR